MMMNDIRTLRLQANIRQKDLSELSDIGIQRLRKIERGFEAPTMAEIKSIAQILSADQDALASAQASLVSHSIPGEGYKTAIANSTSVSGPSEPAKTNKLKVLDLFCGCGGMSFGFEAEGNYTVTAGIDLLADRIATFQLNHKNAHGIQADLRDFPKDELSKLAGNPDIIIGGPPCQGFSSIRPFRQLTEGDPRNSLVEEFVLTVGHIRPRWFVFENVVGLLTSKKGEAFRTLLEGFNQIRYEFDWRIINAAHFGLPQARERLVIVGNRDGEKFDWPSPTHKYDCKPMAGKNAKLLLPEPLFSGSLQDAVSVDQAIMDLPPVESGTSASQYAEDRQISSYAQNMKLGSTELTMHEATRHSEKMMNIIRHAGHNINALPPGMVTSGFSSCYSRLEADRPSTTITVNFVHPASNRCIHPTQNRALTPREGARLQSFPDRFKFSGSRAQIVKQIGNAVPPLLGEVIARGLSQSVELHTGQANPRKSA